MGYITNDFTESNLELKKSLFFNRLDEEFSNYFNNIKEFRGNLERRDHAILVNEAKVGELYYEVIDKYEGSIIIDKVDNKNQSIIIGDEVNELHTEAYKWTLRWRKKFGTAILKDWSQVYEQYFLYNLLPQTDSFQEIIIELDSLGKLKKAMEEINAQYDTYFEHLKNLNELLLKNLKLANECEVD